MSLFPESITAQIINDSKQHSVQQRIITAISDFRFKPYQTYDQIIKLLKTNAVKQLKLIKFNYLNKQIVYHSEQDVLKAIKYFTNMKNMNQILSDLYYNQQYNHQFIKMLDKTNNKPQNTANQELFKNKLKLVNLSYYILKQVQLLFCDQFIAYLILDQYFTLFNKNIQSSVNDHIPMINNNYNMCFVKTNQINQTFNITLGLAFTTNLLSISHIAKSASHINKLKITKIIQQKKINKKQIIKDKFYYIPLEIVQKIFKILDRDKDNFIDAKDIKRQFQNNFISFQDNFYQQMIKDAKLHSLNIKNRDKLTLRQVYYTMQSKKNKKHGLQTISERPYKKYWIWLIKKVIYKADIQNMNLQPKSNVYKSHNGNFLIKQIKNKQVHKRYHPQAGLIINNTLNIQEVCLTNQQPNNSHSLELLINSCVKHSIIQFKNAQKYQTIGFEAQRFYKLNEKGQIKRK